MALQNAFLTCPVLQTLIIATNMQYYICTYLTRHMLELADGGQLAMDWLDVGEKDVDLPVLVILPGLTG